jgi:hypothetical protein
MSEPAPSSSQAHLDLIARETGIRPASVAATAKLLA